MNTIRDTAPTVSPGALTALRDLGRDPASSLEAMRHIAAQQAGLLRGLLPAPVGQAPAHLASLFPTIVVESAARLPVPGITFWANHRWHIHVREDDSADERAFTVLHQLKHIIDHPIRRVTTAFSDADWDALAKHFACLALARELTAASA
ncbi:hypothetical protein [Streptomyces scabiei]|nr:MULTISPECIES: hypothetical protein [Streptomyces]MBP5867901.1 hypothetical protein [Streptomyces sp. LBUM 1485]MBP5930898.1 hypothetical protein [Streptomyces sp. LBUM 1479]MBP5916290.1 hypothetical protein [Streptomyces sp. LBUM 1486]MDX2536794.1 hypothetical protein [Streptomyces scabiei]MDX2798495.1 hypothetical protein [Streptomyces scabiei]